MPKAGDTKTKTLQTRCRLRVITPKYAQELIDATGSRNFRKPDLNRVKVITDDIENGRWKVNGATIIVDGRIIVDGMHRLLACVDSGKSIQTFVVEGLDEDARLTIDAVRPRNLAQWLSHQGVKSANGCASVTRNWFAYRKDYWNKEILPSESVQVLLADFIKRERIISEAVHLCSESTNHFRALTFVPASIMGTVLCEGTNKSFCSPTLSEHAKLFVYQLRTGESKTKNTPVLHFRNRMCHNSKQQVKMTRTLTRALLIYTWNLFVNGETVDVLKFRLSGPRAQDFPVITQANS